MPDLARPWVLDVALGGWANCTFRSPGFSATRSCSDIESATVALSSQSAVITA